MSTEDPLYSRRPLTSDISVQLPRTILPMPSESSPGDFQTSFSTKKGGLGGGSATQPKLPPDSTSTASSTIMSFVPSSSGGGGSSDISAPVIVGPTTATGGGSANKRGRKPGLLSKSAREAQRRLNHSIIEKARRTKINDALATLKQLVPVDYLQTREMKKAAADESDHNDINEDDGEDDFDDDDEDGDEEGSEYREPLCSNTRTPASASSIMNIKQSSNGKTNPAPASKGGKKQEKEKEFKLEILVRTVVFLQDLLERVDHLEAAVGTPQSSSNPEHCTTCGNVMSPSSSMTTTTTTTNNNRKRKREYFSSPTIEKEDLNDAPHERGQSRSRVKIARTGLDIPPTPHFSPQRQRAEKHMGAQSPRHTVSSSPSLSSSSSAENKRLPSISSWLNNDEHAILPSPLSFSTFVGTVTGKGSNKVIYSLSDDSSTSNAASNSHSYLPSPPPSTHCFDPIRTYTSTQVPPLLNLGPGATSASASSSIGTRTTPPTMSKSKSFTRSPASFSGAQLPSGTPPTPIMLTPEDESAASMLLQIASSSPQFRPINPPAPSSSRSSASFDSSRTKSTTTSPTFSGYPHSHTHSQRPRARSHVRPHQPQPDNNQHPQTQYDPQPTVSVRQVETPSSILGIRKY